MGCVDLEMQYKNIFGYSPKELKARIHHIAWIAYQVAVEQDYNEQPNKDQLDSLIDAQRRFNENPNITAEQNHNNWMQFKTSQGWKYGPVKDFDKKEHPDMVPFDQLPVVEKRKDIMDNTVRRLINELIRT